jgi:hypothetical protein
MMTDIQFVAEALDYPVPETWEYRIQQDVLLLAATEGTHYYPMREIKASCLHRFLLGMSSTHYHRHRVGSEGYQTVLDSLVP